MSREDAHGADAIDIELLEPACKALFKPPLQQS
jgi:hypothetical protein